MHFAQVTSERGLEAIRDALILHKSRVKGVSNPFGMLHFAQGTSEWGLEAICDACILRNSRAKGVSKPFEPTHVIHIVSFLKGLRLITYSYEHLKKKVICS